MRLLIALPDLQLAQRIQREMENRLWEAEMVCSGQELLHQADSFDVLLVHHCLPVLDGGLACEMLASTLPLKAPKILYLCPLELANSKPAWADCMVHAGVSVERLCTLIALLGEKAISHIAAAQLASVARLTEQFLDEIAMKPRIKGRAYAAWLLKRMIISPRWAQQPLNQCYAACAQAFGVSPASVERCLRSAVESVFTQGSLSGIERFFGATIDPERGKPTNRAFLLQAAQQLQLIPLP